MSTAAENPPSPPPVADGSSGAQQHHLPPEPESDDQQFHSVLSLEPDTATPSDSDADSAFGGGHSTASTSLASSIQNYEYSNGRRYHGYRSGAYVLPNDDEEQDRLDLLHHIFLMMMGGKLYAAPIEPPPRRVLDIGTGTGIWAIDFADEHPSSTVIGTDLSPIQPTWIPPNARFYIDDAESEWVYPSHDRFDFIHIRTLSGSISDWDRLIRQCYNNMQPGGWLEFQEPLAWVESDDGTIEKAVNVHRWQELCNEAAARFGKEIRAGEGLKERVARAGFEDVQERVIKVPLGPWPKSPTSKDLGRYQREHMAMGVEPYTYGFIGKVLGWSEAECKVLIAKVVNEVRDRSLHLYIRFFFVWGRRPVSS